MESLTGNHRLICWSCCFATCETGVQHGAGWRPEAGGWWSNLLWDPFEGTLGTPWRKNINKRYLMHLFEYWIYMNLLFLFLVKGLNNQLVYDDFKDTR